MMARWGGWTVRFGLAVAAAILVADLISKSITTWLEQHPEISVRSTLPIVKDGQTIAVHVWYDVKG